ncbi:MAG: hypothetical protein KF769_13065 [Parvibaculum sp.]|nr:hypothetical protein [Parvibaculum sp.]
MSKFSCPRAMRSAAEALEIEAATLRRHAEIAEQRAADKRRMAEFPKIWRHVTRLIEDGIDEPRARAIVANQLGIEIATVDHWMQRSELRSAALKVWRRDREIFQRAHVLSNIALAELYGLTPTTISRIIRRQLERRYRRGTPAQFG